MATQFGTDLIIGVGQTIASYIVESRDLNGADIKQEDIFDENGARATRIVMQVDDKITLNLIQKTGATPTTDWPEGAIATVTGFTSFFVDSAVQSRTEGAARVTVGLTNIGIT